MKPPPDRRVVRTRRQLREALVTLILERGWEQVSVQNVCAHANVGRSTFYLHFADKEELLLSGFDELHAALEVVRREQVGTFGFAEALFEHARDNLRLFRAGVGRKAGPQVLRRFCDVVLELVLAELECVELAEADRTHAARYISGGFMELLTSWLDRPSRVEPAELGRAFRALTEGVLSAVPRRARKRRPGG